jgi:hypothetical protein
LYIFQLAAINFFLAMDYSKIPLVAFSR